MTITIFDPVSGKRVTIPKSKPRPMPGFAFTAASTANRPPLPRPPEQNSRSPARSLIRVRL